MLEDFDINKYVSGKCLYEMMCIRKTVCASWPVLSFLIDSWYWSWIKKNGGNLTSKGFHFFFRRTYICPFFSSHCMLHVFFCLYCDIQNTITAQCGGAGVWTIWVDNGQLSLSRDSSLSQCCFWSAAVTRRRRGQTRRCAAPFWLKRREYDEDDNKASCTMYK